MSLQTPPDLWSLLSRYPHTTNTTRLASNNLFILFSWQVEWGSSGFHSVFIGRAKPRPKAKSLYPCPPFAGVTTDHTNWIKKGILDFHLDLAALGKCLNAMTSVKLWAAMTHIDDQLTWPRVRLILLSLTTNESQWPREAGIVFTVPTSRQKKVFNKTGGQYLDQ